MMHWSEKSLPQLFIVASLENVIALFHRKFMASFAIYFMLLVKTTDLIMSFEISEPLELWPILFESWLRLTVWTLDRECPWLMHEHWVQKHLNQFCRGRGKGEVNCKNLKLEWMSIRQGGIEQGDKGDGDKGEWVQGGMGARGIK